MIALHIGMLYGTVLAVVCLAAFKSDRKANPLRPWELPRAIWPFVAVGCLEALMLRASGHLRAEWALPCLGMGLVLLLGPPPQVRRWSRRVLVLLCIVLWLHGGLLLSHDYTMNPKHPVPGTRIERGWYTPLNGMRRVIRP